MSFDALLENALREYRIPYPQNRASSTGFIRWGKNQRYWAVLVDDGYFFGDFATDLSTMVFPEKKINAFDRNAHLKKVHALMDQMEAERAFFHKATQQRAQKIWENTPFLTFSHEYLKKKKALNHGLKIAGEGFLIIPLSDINGTLWTLQFIDGNGKKRFLRNGKKTGNFFMFKQTQKRIFICEGYATGSSIFQAMQESVVCCFDAGNIACVAPQLALKYPDSELIFCADNDRFNEINIGLEKAKSIAGQLKAKVVYPVFDENDTQSTDFNDLHCWYGLDAVRRQIGSSLNL